MNDTDANSGVANSFERARLLIALGWLVKAAGLVLVGIYFWVGVLLFVISWGLDASVFPARPAPDARDKRLKWALLALAVLFFGGWIAGMLRQGSFVSNPALVAGLIGIIICESSRYLRADIEYLRRLRELELPATATAEEDLVRTKEKSAPVQEELPL
jgi:hypothetical protein